MSGLHFRPFEMDALSESDSFEERAKFLLNELERNWKATVAQLEAEAKHWQRRFEMYQQHCARAQREKTQLNLNPIGELQGNLYRFENLAKQCRDLEDSIDGIRKILYPAEEKTPIKSAGAAKKRPRAAGRSK